MPDLPLSLQRLLDMLQADIAGVTATLEDGDSVTEWRDAMAATLARGHLAGYATGQGAFDFTDRERKALLKEVSVQLEYLDNFATEIQAAEAFEAGWQSRAQMYADNVKVPYWQGRTKMYPLPYMPAQGTQCLTKCRCTWEIDELEGDGNANAYWRRGASDSCQTCVEREAATVQIRDGVLL